jgi:catechol 2,3-dioxygenase-like lactoylglutathione lyase family enzyme
MITGVHAMMYSPKAEAIRAFFRDVLELPHVDAGHGWLLFRGPPLELAAHPSEGAESSWAFSLMCDDLDATLKELAAKGVGHGEVKDAGWGKISSITLPDGSDLMIYQPLYPTAI